MDRLKLAQHSVHYHNPVQHRDGRVAWCNWCGRDKDFQEPANAFESQDESTGFAVVDYVVGGEHNTMLLDEFTIETDHQTGDLVFRVSSEHIMTKGTDIKDSHAKMIAYLNDRKNAAEETLKRYKKIFKVIKDGFGDVEDYHEL